MMLMMVVLVLAARLLMMVFVLTHKNCMVLISAGKGRLNVLQPRCKWQ